MRKFNLSEKVYIKKVGLSGFIEGYNLNDNNIYLIKLETNEEMLINEKDIEKFIKPKFKVGDKIYTFPIFDSCNKDCSEIVKCALNKKLGVYCYMAFSLDCGFPTVYRESEVIKFGTKPKPVIEEMTMEQVCRKLGKEIKIIK